MTDKTITITMLKEDYDRQINEIFNKGVEAGQNNYSPQTRSGSQGGEKMTKGKPTAVCIGRKWYDVYLRKKPDGTYYIWYWNDAGKRIRLA